MDSTALVTYSVTEAEIARTRDACALLRCDTPAGYEAVRVAIGNLRTTRTAIEKRRVELKADALKFGRFVDTEAKRFTDLIVAIEDPLKAKKAVIDDEADRVKREKEAAALKIVQDEIDRHATEKAAAEKAIRDAEDARMAAERETLRIERERLAGEQAKLDSARTAEEARASAARRVEEDRLRAEREKVEVAQRAEREAIEVERRIVEAARQAAERIEFERQAKIKAEKDAAEKVERDRIEKARRDAELATLAPDLVKVEAFVAAIRALQAPKVKSKKLTEILAGAMSALTHVANDLAANMTATKGGK